jgi:hypothetical protein
MTESNLSFYDLYLSYERSVESQVKNLYNKLKSDMKICSKFENTTSTIDQIAKSIKNTKLFVCILTKKYSDVRLDELERIGMIVAGLNRINCFNNQNTWFDYNFNDIKKLFELKLRVFRLFNTLFYFKYIYLKK